MKWLTLLASVVAVATVLPEFARSASGDLYVDKANPACSNSGPGSITQPLCSIGAGAARVVAGQSVLVSGGTYSEVVTVTRSGSVGAPVVFAALPGATVTVSGGSSGFLVTGKSYVTIRGFRVTGTTSSGILVSSSSWIVVEGNDVSYSGLPVAGMNVSGIRLNGSTDSRLVANTVHHNTDFGIFVSGGSTRNEVSGNEVFANARGFQRAASGIRVYQAPGNTIHRNISHDNEDSGIECYAGSNSTLVYNNVTYNNGDHGIDNHGCTGQRIIANSVFDNVTAGINLELNSTGATVVNNISVDNGIGSPRTRSNIRVESGSTSGTTLDSNLVYLSSPDTMLIWNSVSYTSLAAFQAASGQESHGIQANPKWKNAASGDFHLLAGSAAIDSADSGASGQPATDLGGNARIDDPATPNTGLGSRAYDDRGAYEYQPSESAPVAALSVSPLSGAAPLAVSADASGSTDGDLTPIVSYTFDFGDATTVGPQAGATATHTYTTAGSYTVTVTVIDTAGLSSQATRTVNVSTPSTNLVGNPGFETNLSGWNTSGTNISLTRVAGGHSGSFAAKLTNTGTTNSSCTLNDSPNWVTTTSAGTYTASIWVRADSAGASLILRFREYNKGTSALLATVKSTITLSTSWQQVTLSYPSPGSTNLDFNAYTNTANSPPGTCFYADDAAIVRAG